MDMHSPDCDTNQATSSHASTDNVQPSDYDKSPAPSTSQASSHSLLHYFDIGEVLSAGEYGPCDNNISDMPENMKYNLWRHHFDPDSQYTLSVTYQHGCNRRCKLDTWTIISNTALKQTQFFVCHVLSLYHH